MCRLICTLLVNASGYHHGRRYCTVVKNVDCCIHRHCSYGLESTDDRVDICSQQVIQKRNASFHGACCMLRPAIITSNFVFFAAGRENTLGTFF